MDHAATEWAGAVTALPGVTDTDLDIMARTIWAEARGEPYAGRVAVAWVIRNRVEDARWPNTVHAVCLQKWQFECWNGETVGAQHQDKNYFAMKNATLATPGFLSAIGVAAGVLAGDLSPVLSGDAVRGANHHYNPAVSDPSWARGVTPVATIGKHVFLWL